MNDDRTILVVDDESESLSLLTNLLTAEGYKVRPADSGELALASIAVKAPELILLDIRMPGMGGFEVCRRLKASASSHDIPILFVTASPDVEERVEGLALGAVDFISKPFQPQELLARVRTHLELGRLRADLARQVAERTAELQAANAQLKLDLLERERNEQVLRESEERFRNMADGAPTLIWVSGPDKLCTFFNKGWLAFTGRTMEQELGNGWTAGVHPDDLERCLTTYTSSFDDRRDFEMEYRLRRADGTYRWVLDIGVPRFDAGSLFAGYIGSCIDTTDFKRSQEQLLAAQKLESLGVLAAGMAHNFRNLLGSIFGETDLALSELAPDVPARENVERIGVIASRASEIINLLIAYAGNGDDPAMSEPVDLSSLVEDVLSNLRNSVSSKVVLDTNLARDLPPVRVKASQIRLVVMNLIKNAFEVLEGQDGLIRVTTGLKQIGSESKGGGAADLPSGHYVCLEVSDTGCGMSEEACAKVFDPFYSTKFLGRGLGLAAVHGIVRSHGGTIKVVSEPSSGTKFEVLLPSGF